MGWFGDVKSKFGGKVVEVDNRSDSDNWLVNKSGTPVTVACEEMFGSFAVDLAPRQKKRITFGVKANVYPMGEYTYEDLKYEIGRNETWEARRDENGSLILVKR
jgi:hypothetical protein